MTDPSSGIQVYAGADAGEYFEDLEIQKYSLFGDESLAVKERLV